MRQATFEHDFWQLRSGEELHRQDPDAFRLPPLADRRNLNRGQAVKLIFDIEGEEEDGSVAVQGERMWVIVAERVGDAYIGILDNQPAYLDPVDGVYLRFGAEVPFRAENVIDIAQPPAEYVEWQLGRPPERVWPRGTNPNAEADNNPFPPLPTATPSRPCGQ